MFTYSKASINTRGGAWDVLYKMKYHSVSMLNC